jgi:large subunit ribosomal protein L4
MAEKKKPASGKADKASAPAAKGKAAKPAKSAAPARAAKPAGKAPRKRRDISEEDTARLVRGAGGDVTVASSSTLAVVDASNTRVRDVTLHPEVFGVEPNEHLLWEAVKQYRAGGRRGTHMTKNRALVSGTGKKPWRQKGTGRARVGEARNPLWRHGGTVFGPVPRDYSYSVPRKARLVALRSALSRRVSEGALKVVDRFAIETPKTKILKGLLDTLGAAGKTLLVEHRPSDALLLSGRNIPGLKIVDPSHVNVYDVLDCGTVLVSQEALSKLEERLTP